MLSISLQHQYTKTISKKKIKILFKTDIRICQSSRKIESKAYEVHFFRNIISVFDNKISSNNKHRNIFI